MKLSIAIFTMTSLFPAMIVTGFVDLLEMPLWLAGIIAVIGGVFGGALFHPRPEVFIQGIVSGVVFNTGIFLFTIWYTSARQTFYSTELVITILIGGTPGGLLYYTLLKDKFFRS